METGSGHSHSVGYEYDTINNLTKMVETINGTAHTTSYTYDDDNRVTEVAQNTTKQTYGYDSYGRMDESTVSFNGATIVTSGYTYKNPTATTTSAQMQNNQKTRKLCKQALWVLYLLVSIAYVPQHRQASGNDPKT